MRALVPALLSHLATVWDGEENSDTDGEEEFEKVTDEVMAELAISRGNAHTNLKDLVNWGLIRIVTRKGDRKEYFEAELDVWEIFRRIVQERKRREIDPALDLLQNCLAESKGIRSAGGRAFHDQMQSLEEFVSFASIMSDRVASMPHGKAMQLAMKLFG